MIAELDCVILNEDLPEAGLKRGSVGTVVLMHGDEAYEVEFMTDEGDTVAVVTLRVGQVREMSHEEACRERNRARGRHRAPKSQRRKQT